MSTAHFCFHGRLNDFLPPAQRDRPLLLHFQGRQSLKHLAEALGVPHPEIGAARVRDQAIALEAIPNESHLVEFFPDDRAAVDPHFVLDCHLGRLAAHLRMLGFDCLYENDYQDDTLAALAAGGERILLTRDRRLLMRKTVTRGYCLRSLDPETQGVEVLQRYDLAGQIRPFQRCLRCNQPLQAVEKDVILEQLEPLTRIYFDEFHRCPGCGQIYWKGSHYQHMLQQVEQARARTSGGRA